jgi:hypothetical protein
MKPTPARPLEAPIADYPGALDYAAVEEFLRLLYLLADQRYKLVDPPL